MNRRVVWIDWAKAILIYLMVVGHGFPVAWENKLIYAFHMPAFFIISGYLYRPHHWLKTLKSFGIPILFFSSINMVIYCLPKLLRGTFEGSHLLTRLLVPFWGPGPKDLDYILLFPGVWFVIALFLCRLLMGDIMFFEPVRKYKYISIVVLLCFLFAEPFLLPNNPLQEYKFYRAIPALPFVLLGYCMKDWFNIDKMKAWMAIVSTGCFVLLSFSNGYCNMLEYEFGMSYVVYFITALCGSFSLYYVCSKLPRRSYAEVVSVGTMMILAMNFNGKIFFSTIFSKIGLGLIVSDQYLYPWIVGFFIVALCYYPIKFMLKRCSVLLGK